MSATVVLEKHQLPPLTVDPDFFGAETVTVESAAAVNVFVPWLVHPVHEIVSPPADCVVTVRVVVPLTPLWLAVIVVVPVLTAVARPVLLTVATPGEEELQVAEEDR